jgi:hypothetical protein
MTGLELKNADAGYYSRNSIIRAIVLLAELSMMDASTAKTTVS